jgi:hypothetical protein
MMPPFGMPGMPPSAPQNPQNNFPNMTPTAGFGFPPFPWMMGQGNSQPSFPDLSSATTAAPEVTNESSHSVANTKIPEQQASVSITTTASIPEKEIKAKERVAEKIEPMDVDQKEEAKESKVEAPAEPVPTAKPVEDTEIVEPVAPQEKQQSIEKQVPEEKQAPETEATKKRKDSSEGLQNKPDIAEKTPKKPRSETNGTPQTPSDSPVKKQPASNPTPKVSVPQKKRLGTSQETSEKAADKGGKSTSQYDLDTPTVPITARLGDKTPPITARLGDKPKLNTSLSVESRLGDPPMDLNGSRSTPPRKEESQKSNGTSTPIAARLGKPADRQILTGEDGPVIVVQQDTPPPGFTSTYNTPIGSQAQSPSWSDAMDNGENITIKLVDEEAQELDARRVTIDEHGWSEHPRRDASSHSRSNSVTRSPTRSSSEEVVFRVTFFSGTRVLSGVTRELIYFL